MSPSDLSWLQQCLFFFLSVAAGYGLNGCRNRRTNRGTSDVELSGIRVDKRITPTPVVDAQSSGGDEEARPSSNLSNPVGEAMASTGSLRLRSESLRRPKPLLEHSAETRHTSHFFESVAQMVAPNLARRETASSTTVVDRSPSPISSSTAELLRPSGGNVCHIAAVFYGEEESRPSKIGLHLTISTSRNKRK